MICMVQYNRILHHAQCTAGEKGNGLLYQRAIAVAAAAICCSSLAAWCVAASILCRATEAVTEAADYM